MQPPSRSRDKVNRRQFLQTTALAGASLLTPWGYALRAETNAPSATALAPATLRTSADRVALGKTGLKLSRLGIGTGSTNGEVQVALGRKGFNELIRYAYDQGITYIDTSESYMTFELIRGAIEGLPREKLFIQSKMERPDADTKASDVLDIVDRHRKMFNTDYIDSMLLHCLKSATWPSRWKRVMEGLDMAKEKKWIRAHGVSCHSLPALSAAVESNWTDVLLVRVNPQGLHVDNDDPFDDWGITGRDINPIIAHIKAAEAKGKGIIGMKIFANGELLEPAEREKSVQFAMSKKEIHAVVIGLANRAEVDEAVERINRALKPA